MREVERAGECGQRPAALGIAGRAKIIHQQPQLVIAAWLIGKTVEKLGKAIHEALPS